MVRIIIAAEISHEIILVLTNLKSAPLIPGSGHFIASPFDRQTLQDFDNG